MRVEHHGSSVLMDVMEVMELRANWGDELAFDVGLQERRGNTGMPHELKGDLRRARRRCQWVRRT
jgi:hypothetical protein